MPSRAAELLDVIDVGYASAAHDRLTRVIEAARMCLPDNVGVAGFRFTKTARVTPIEVVEDASIRGAVRACFTSAEQALVPAFEHTANANVATDVAWARGRFPSALGCALDDIGIQNIFGVLARSEGAEGLWLGCGLVGVAHADDAMRRSVSEWRMVANHLSLAMRIDAMGGESRAAASFDVRGRGDFSSVPAPEREAVIDLARRLERTRDAAAAQPEALDAWSLLASGRYTLVRRVDEAGAVRFVAFETAHARRSRGLTTFEREVVERVAMGQSNKAIAIDLVCAEPRVAVTAKRAMTKLGVVHRAELVKLLAVLRAS